MNKEKNAEFLDTTPLESVYKRPGTFYLKREYTVKEVWKSNGDNLSDATSKLYHDEGELVHIEESLNKHNYMPLDDRNSPDNSYLSIILRKFNKGLETGNEELQKEALAGAKRILNEKSN